MTTTLDPTFPVEVAAAGPFDAAACMNCGVCTAVCPLGLELLPRKLFHAVLLGLREQVVSETETLFSCLLCRACEESCPAGVHITENVRTLRHYVDRELFGL
jgi:heterodisulfide reductase subunit C2